jgi:hypothetical protein
LMLKCFQRRKGIKRIVNRGYHFLAGSFAKNFVFFLCG